MGDGKRWTVLCVVAAVAGWAMPAAATELPEGFRLEPVVGGLTEPSSVATAPDGRILITERTTGDLRQVRMGELESEPLCHVDVQSAGEAGLLGVAVHPAFVVNGRIYLYYTDLATGTNKVTRFTVGDTTCGGALDIVTGLGGGGGFTRNGGGIAFGPDGKLYVATGDGEVPSDGQNPAVRAGKILRVNDDGSTPSDNPTPGSLVYAQGVRDGRGLAVEVGGQVYASDGGELADASADELNAVPAGGDLGWDSATGDSGGVYDDPLLSWTSPIGVDAVALYAAQAFPDLAADGLDSDHDRFGPDLQPGVAHADDNNAGVCLGSVNYEQACTSSADCPDRAGENARCYFNDDPAEYCPGGSALGDDACGAEGTDEPDESFVGNLFLVGANDDQVLRVVTDPADRSKLDSSSVFLDSTYLGDCPTDWSGAAAGNDGLLYLVARNGGGSAGRLYRVVYDDTPGPREVSAPGGHFPVKLAKGTGADDVVVYWEDLRDDAKQPRDVGSLPQTPRREYTLWQGEIGTWYSHDPVAGFDAITGSAVNDAYLQTELAAGGGSSYFLVSASADNLRGSVGNDSAGAQRPGYAETDMCASIGYHEGAPASPGSGWLFFTCGKNFTLLDEHGEQRSLYDFRGHPLLMDMAADWCGPCEAQADQMENLYQTYRGHGLKMLTVFMDEENAGVDWVGRPSHSECLDWADRPSAPDHTFACVADPIVDLGQPSGGQVAWPAYNRTGFLPTNVLFDSGMRVVYNDGGFDQVTLRDLIERMLGRLDRCLH